MAVVLAATLRSMLIRLYAVLVDLMTEKNVATVIGRVEYSKTLERWWPNLSATTVDARVFKVPIMLRNPTRWSVPIASAHLIAAVDAE
jgi:hypothetical protein